MTAVRQSSTIIRLAPQTARYAKNVKRFVHIVFSFVYSKSSRKAVFRPRISVVRVTAHFPEAKDITIQESDFADELRPLPGVALRDDDARRSTVFLAKWFAVPRMRDHHVVVHADIERVVCRVTVVALEENMGGVRFRFHEVGQREEGHSLEFHVELAPGRDTV